MSATPSQRPFATCLTHYPAGQAAIPGRLLLMNEMQHAMRNSVNSTISNILNRVEACLTLAAKDISHRQAFPVIRHPPVTFNRKRSRKSLSEQISRVLIT